MSVIRDKQRLINISLFIFVLFMPFGQKLFGRFAVANIGQIASFVCLLPVIFKQSKKYYVYNVASIALIIVSSLITVAQFGVQLRVGHIGFFSMICIYMSALIAESRAGSDILSPLAAALNLEAKAYFLPYIAYGLYDMKIVGHYYSAYMFDDKSHVVIFFTFLAFFLLSGHPTKLELALSVGYFALIFTTGSRFSVILMPFYVAALYIMLLKNARDVKAKAIIAGVLTVLLLLGAVYVITHPQYFAVLERLKRGGVSNTSHLMLVVYALKLKFSNIFIFLLGAGPGTFSDLLVNTVMDLSAIARDGGSLNYIAAGLLPVHSSHVELFLDFSLFGFIVYVKFCLEILTGQFKSKNWHDMLFYIAFIGVEMLYSTFHELLFYVIMLYMFSNRAGLLTARPTVKDILAGKTND